LLSADQKEELQSIVDESLDRAESIWNKHGMALDESILARADSVLKHAETHPSKIPGHANVTFGEEVVDNFIALVADIRHSSDHLNCAIGGNRPSQMKRVVFETSALLPALERTLQFYNGSVTEYLGDGVLALFQIPTPEAEKGDAIKNSYWAAKDCLGDTRDIVNSTLAERYDLPSLDLGIGMAMSPAVISLVGLKGLRHPKAIGQCVYRATKLSAGFNEVFVDKAMNDAWPTSKGGKLSFIHKKMRSGVDGYKVADG